MLPGGVYAQYPLPGVVSRPSGSRKMGLQRPLTNTRSPRDNYAYRASFAFQNHPRIPPPEILHDHCRRPADRPC